MVKVKETLLDQISNLSVINQLVETIYVDSSTGRLETLKVVKNNGLVKTINDDVDYKLKTNSFILKGNIIISDIPYSKTIVDNEPLYKCVSSNINKVFIEELKLFKNIQTSYFKLINRSFVKKIFNKNNNKKLIDKIIKTGDGCSWVIIPSLISHIVKTSPDFIQNDIKSDALIYNFGRLKDINIYVNPDERELCLYFGNYDSVTIIINKNIKNLEFKTLNSNSGHRIEIDYIFLEKGITKLLKIE